MGALFPVRFKMGSTPAWVPSIHGSSPFGNEGLYCCQKSILWVRSSRLPANH
jgi:hypothetical protein